MKKKLSVVLLFISFTLCLSANNGIKTYDSYKGLVMAGYQGWFNTPDDGAGRGWYHYSGKNGFRPGSASVDMWPDVSEYDKLYKTEFTFSDGKPAYTFSSHDESTVDVHFRWMKEYGLDGVFMQRFVNEIKRPSGKNHFNVVLNSAMKAANKYNRAICVMYDLSGMQSGDEKVLLADFDELVKLHNIKDHAKNPSYLYHNGKPLVVIWGVGFNDGRRYNLNDIEIMIDALKEKGFSVMLGVPTFWRRLTGDTVNDPHLHALIKKSDIVMPWFVGRYNENTHNRFMLEKDFFFYIKDTLQTLKGAFYQPNLTTTRLGGWGNYDPNYTVNLQEIFPDDSYPNITDMALAFPPVSDTAAYGFNKDQAGGGGPAQQKLDAAVFIVKFPGVTTDEGKQGALANMSANCDNYDAIPAIWKTI